MTRKLSLIGAAILLLGSFSAHAGIAEGKIKIGVLGDMSGGYSDTSGQGAVVAAQMAVESFGGVVAGLPIEIVSADHLNKADVAANVARRWFDVENVDMITDLVNSATALAVSNLGKEKNKVVLVSGAGVTDLTGQQCTANTLHWTYDTYSIPKSTTGALMEKGYKDWYFITADYSFGKSMESQAGNFVEERGGKVIGAVRHPVYSSDFSSYLLAAKASGAQVIALANAGTDASTAIKQAAEFGVGGDDQRLTGLLITVSEIHALGAEVAEGLIVTTPFYWDRNEETRKFTAEYSKRTGGKYPTMMQAGVYSSVTHYLKAIEALQTDDGAAIVAKMKELPTDDPLFGKGSVRQDGRKLHPMYVYQVKSPSESSGPWDLYKLLDTISPEDAFRPMAEGDCPLVN